VLIRQAAETGQLYGSVTPRDLAEAITAAGFSVSRGQIGLKQPIKSSYILQPGPAALTEGIRQIHARLAGVVGVPVLDDLAPRERMP